MAGTIGRRRAELGEKARLWVGAWLEAGDSGSFARVLAARWNDDRRVGDGGSASHEGSDLAGRRDVRVEDAPDPRIEQPTDAVISITSTGLCGSDLYLYEVLTPFMTPGDILGHEPIGVVEETGAEVTRLRKGDRVVVPFQISCGHCFMCSAGLMTQCETTQVTGEGMGAALFGYTRLYGAVRGAQAEYLRVPQAQFGPIKVPAGPPDDRFVYRSDVLPTAWQAVEYAGVQPGGALAVLGLGPIGDMCCRIAKARGMERVFGVDLVPERLARASRRGTETYDLRAFEDEKTPTQAIRDETAGRGPDAVIDAVGTEAHGSVAAKLAQTATGLLPRKLSAPLAERFAVDRQYNRRAFRQLLPQGADLVEALAAHGHEERVVSLVPGQLGGHVLGHSRRPGAR